MMHYLVLRTTFTEMHQILRKEKEGIILDRYNRLNRYKLVYKKKQKAKKISRNDDKLKKSKGDSEKKKQTMPNGKTQLMTSEVMMRTSLFKEEGLMTEFDNRLKRYKQRKKNEETKNTCGTRKCSSRDDKLKKSKAGGKKKKQLALLTTRNDSIQAGAVKEGQALRIHENGENCQRMIPAFPVEWEDPLLPGVQQHMHKQYLQDRFFKLLLKRSRETQLNYRQSKKRSNKKQRDKTRHGMSVKKVTLKLQKDGWIDYETVPEIVVLQDSKRYIQKLKTK